ncbi:MAG: hypothetical protein AB7V26_00670 [Lysobacterales bacterium]
MQKPASGRHSRQGKAAILRRRPLALGISVLLFGGSLSTQAVAQAFPDSINLGSLDGANGFRIDGVGAGDWSGISVSAAGDINDDGLSDLIIGARHADPNGIIYAGSSYVVFGQSTPFAGIVALSGLDGNNGFRIDGMALGDQSGISVSAAGDINGDGIGDLVIGAWAADPNGLDTAGSSYVVFGHSTPFAATLALGNLNGDNGFRLDGEAAGDYSGQSVSAAGDVNGDGLADLIVGAWAADPNGLIAAGSSYVVFGQQTPFEATVALSGLNGTNGFRLDGVAEFDHSGRSVSAAGDINGDGLADLIVGAYGADPNGLSAAGSSYVVFGQTTPFEATVPLSDLNGANGFRLDGVAGVDFSGSTVGAAGDINGDGIGDLIVGAFLADPKGISNAGSSYVVFGKNTPFAATVALSDLNGANGFRLDGVAAYDYSGRSVSAAGDINGDGLADLIIGARGADPSGLSHAGRSYVVFGRRTSFAAAVVLSDLDGANGFRLDGVAANDYSGRSVSAAGDINGDDLGDLIVGAFGADPNGLNEAGSSYVVFGRKPELIFSDSFE